MNSAGNLEMIRNRHLGVRELGYLHSLGLQATGECGGAWATIGMAEEPLARLWRILAASYRQGLAVTD